jgi:hypothetical protein
VLRTKFGYFLTSPESLSVQPNGLAETIGDGEMIVLPWRVNLHKHFTTLKLQIMAWYIVLNENA